jgi:Protein of unknown function (DUF3304)
VRGSCCVCLAAAALALAACDRGPPALQGTASVPAAASAKRGKTISANLTGYNHTDKTIAAFYVDGQWGGNVFPGTGGGKFVCCIALPVPWQEGAKVTVSWEDHELKTHSRDVLVPKYDVGSVSDFNVHFLRSGEIKVFAARGGMRNRDYPFVGPESELKPGVSIEKVQ